MLRPADCQSVSRCLAGSLQQGRPCLAGVLPLVSFLCPEQPSNTVLFLLLTKVLRRSLRGFKRAGSRRFVFVMTRLFLLLFRTQRYPPFSRAAREHPKGVLSHDLSFTDCRLDSQSCVGWFSNFPPVACGPGGSSPPYPQP